MKWIARHEVLGTIYKALKWDVWQVDENFAGNMYSHQFLFSQESECMGYWIRHSHVPTKASDSVGTPYIVEYSEKLECGLQTPLSHSIYTDHVLAMGIEISGSPIIIHTRPFSMETPRFLVGVKDSDRRKENAVWDEIPVIICQMAYNAVKNGESISYSYRKWHYKERVLKELNAEQLYHKVLQSVIEHKGKKASTG